MLGSDSVVVENGPNYGIGNLSNRTGKGTQVSKKIPSKKCNVGLTRKIVCMV